VFAAFLRVRNQHAPEYALDNEHCRVLSASNDKKVSLHIVIAACVFENNHQHLKAFFLALQEFWRSALCDDEDAGCSNLSTMESIPGIGSCGSLGAASLRTQVVHCCEPSGMSHPCWLKMKSF
jgi:hypothetical protein